SSPFGEDEDTSEPAQRAANPFYVVGGAGQARSDTAEEDVTESQITPQFSPSPSSEPSIAGQGQYYLVFVNTPAQSLMKTKVQVDFDTFPTVAIGREAENVVVIPDTEVSRSHAGLSVIGKKEIFKVVGSTKEKYLFDGKDFQ